MNSPRKPLAVAAALLPASWIAGGAGQRRILQRPAIVGVVEVDVARGHRAQRLAVGPPVTLAPPRSST